MNNEEPQPSHYRPPNTHPFYSRAVLPIRFVRTYPSYLSEQRGRTEDEPPTSWSWAMNPTDNFLIIVPAELQLTGEGPISRKGIRPTIEGGVGVGVGVGYRVCMHAVGRAPPSNGGRGRGRGTLRHVVHSPARWGPLSISRIGWGWSHV